MKSTKLTGPAHHVHKLCMEKHRFGPKMVMLALMTSGLAGCITVEAPDKPIVIELNINITQEVIYRLAEDAGNTIEENADIF